MGFNLATMPEAMRRCIPREHQKSLGPAARTIAQVVADSEPQNERDLQRQIIGYLATREVEVCCPSAVKRSTIKLGWPDMTFAFRGIPVVWEIKTPIGKLRSEQEAIIPRLLANGWRHGVIRSVAEAKAFLDALTTEIEQRKLR